MSRPSISDGVCVQALICFSRLMASSWGSNIFSGHVQSCICFVEKPDGGCANGIGDLRCSYSSCCPFSHSAGLLSTVRGYFFLSWVGVFS